MHRRGQDEDGAVLVIVLLFVVVVSVVVGAIIDQVRASIGNTVIVRNQQALTFAADAGIERALQMVRRDSRACTGAGLQALSPPITVNGRQVELRCEMLSGATGGVLGHAVVTLDSTAESLTDQGGGTRKIKGPVWTARLQDSISSLVVSGGDLREGAGSSSCVVGAAPPGGLSFVPAALYGYQCTSDAAPAFAPSLPLAVPAPALPPTTVGACRTFFPGTYTAATWPGFHDENYLVSGVYLFDGVNLTVSGSQRVVGGQRDLSLEQDTLKITPCSNDSVHPLASGTGVKLLLGGSSTLSTTSSGGAMELFARRGGAASEGMQGIAVMQVPNASTGWPGSSLGFGDNILSVASGSNPSLVVHGIVSTPQSRINVDNASGGSSAQFQGGVYTGRLHLQNSGSSSGLVVSIDNDDVARTVKLTASTKLDAGDKAIVATAVVEIQNDDRRTYDIKSWRSTN